MITLAIDTSTPQGAVALLRDEKPLGEMRFERTRPVEPRSPRAQNSPSDLFEPAATAALRTDDLFSAIRALCNTQAIDVGSIDLLAVGRGPGSFTGIRAGIAAAKGMALVKKRPIKGVGSYDALALTALPRLPRDCPQLCVLGDARQDEVYYRIYDPNGRPTSDCKIAALEAIADEIHNPMWFVSSEMAKFADDLRASFGGFATVHQENIYPSAAALGWLAVREFQAGGDRGDDVIEPIYLRETSYRKVS